MATALHSAVRPSAPLVVPPRTRLADMRAEAERLTQHIALVQQHTAALVREEEQARADRDALLREVLKVEGILADVAYKIGGLPQSTRSLVIASDGFTYDSYDLEKYIVGCRAANLEPKSANDGLPLDDSYYPPNSTYREILQLLREALRAPVALDRSPPHSLSTSVVAS